VYFPQYSFWGSSFERTYHRQFTWIYQYNPQSKRQYSILNSHRTDRIFSFLFTSNAFFSNRCIRNDCNKILWLYHYHLKYCLSSGTNRNNITACNLPFFLKCQIILCSGSPAKSVTKLHVTLRNKRQNNRSLIGRLGFLPKSLWTFRREMNDISPHIFFKRSYRRYRQGRYSEQPGSASLSSTK
jgi:hypothetical protein